MSNPETQPNHREPPHARLEDLAPNIDGIEVLEFAGSGGICTVFKARQTAFSRVVALKVLQPKHAIDSTVIQRFNREAKLSSSLVHQNIASVLSFGISNDGRSYLLMEYVDGITLEQFLREHAPLAWSDFFEIFSQCLAGLAHAHSHGIIHRDLKPSNIILIPKEGSPKWTLKIIDFGIAKILLDEAASDQQRLTKTGALIGSPIYMSPEQCLGKEIDCRADIYAMGCIMYQAVCAQAPFTGDNALEVMTKHVQLEPVPPHTVPGAKVDRHLEEIILKCLAKSPDDRFSNTRSIITALETVTASSKHSSIDIPASPRNFFKKPAGMKLYRQKTLGLAILISALCLAAIGYFLNNQQYLNDIETRIDSGNYEGATRTILCGMGPIDISPAVARKLSVTNRERFVQNLFLTTGDRQRIITMLCRAATNYSDDHEKEIACDLANFTALYAKQHSLSEISDAQLLPAKLSCDRFSERNPTWLESRLVITTMLKTPGSKRNQLRANVIEGIVYARCARGEWFDKLYAPYRQIVSEDPDWATLPSTSIALCEASQNKDVFNDLRPDQRKSIKALELQAIEDLRGKQVERLCAHQDPEHMRVLALLMSYYNQVGWRELPQYEKSLQLLNNYFNEHRPSHLLYAHTYHAMAEICLEKGELERAEKLDALALSEVRDKWSLEESDMLTFLAFDQLKMQKLQEAKLNTLKAISILAKLKTESPALRLQRHVSAQELLSTITLASLDREGAKNISSALIDDENKYLQNCQDDLRKSDPDQNAVFKVRFVEAMLRALQNARTADNQVEVKRLAKLIVSEYENGHHSDAKAYEKGKKELEALP